MECCVTFDHVLDKYQVFFPPGAKTYSFTELIKQYVHRKGFIDDSKLTTDIHYEKACQRTSGKERLAVYGEVSFHY